MQLWVPHVDLWSTVIKVKVPCRSVGSSVRDKKFWARFRIWQVVKLVRLRHVKRLLAILRAGFVWRLSYYHNMQDDKDGDSDLPTHVDAQLELAW